MECYQNKKALYQLNCVCLVGVVIFAKLLAASDSGQRLVDFNPGTCVDNVQQKFHFKSQV